MNTKIDQALLDQVATKHNTDYPKEYWDNAGNMTTKKREIMEQFKKQFPNIYYHENDSDNPLRQANITEAIEDFLIHTIQQAKREMAEEIINLADIYEKSVAPYVKTQNIIKRQTGNDSAPYIANEISNFHKYRWSEFISTLKYKYLSSNEKNK